MTYNVFGGTLNLAQSICVPCLYSSWIMSGCTTDYSNLVRNGAVFVRYYHVS